MKRFTVLSMLLLMIVSVTLAGNAPRIVQCGLDPVTITPGQDFTLYADVSDADGLSDVNMVGLLSGDDLLMLLPESSTAGRFEVSFTMPDNATAGTYTLSMAAVDSADNVSSITYFTFSIANEGPAVELLSPENGQTVDCEEVTVFEWLPFEGEIGGYAFALNLIEGVQVVANVPDTVTSLPVPGALWSMMPDGEYFWQVGVLPKEGGEPYAWSELRSFITECNTPMPGEIYGVVLEKDPDAQTLIVRSNWERGPHGTTVQVTSDTVIWNENGEMISFDDIEVGSSIFSIGEYQENLFVAIEIFVEGEQPPAPSDEVMGNITQIDLENNTITLNCAHQGDETLVQITDETELFNEYGSITIDDIELEDFADAFGSWDGDLFVADEIFVMGYQGPGHGDHYTGEILAIDSENLTFELQFVDHGAAEIITVQVTEETILEGVMGPIDFNDIEIGFRAEVAGTWTNDIFDAIVVFVYDEQHPPQPTDLYGTIVSIDAAQMQFSVQPDHWDNGLVIVQVSQETMIEGPMGPMTFDDLAVDQMVYAHGEMIDEILNAYHVFVDDGSQPPHPTDIYGTIVSIDAAQMQFSVQPNHWDNGLVIVQVSEDTTIESHMGPMTFDDLAVDQMVYARGEMIDEILNACHVFVDDGSQPPQPTDIFGTIVSIDAAQMQFAVQPDYWDNGLVIVQVSQETMIEGPMGPMTFDDLAVDQMVYAHGEMVDEILNAYHVFVDDGSQPPQPGENFCGEISEIDYNAMSFLLNVHGHGQQDQIVVQATAETVIFDGFGLEVTFEDIQNDMFAMVMGTFEGDILVAEEILLPE